MSQHRRNIHRLLNPPLYYATSYGEKLHLDQNEMLTRFGVTRTAAIDGYSNIIYNVLRPLLINDGLWEQVRIDHGGEFALIAAVQLELLSLRHPCNRCPVI